MDRDLNFFPLEAGIRNTFLFLFFPSLYFLNLYRRLINCVCKIITISIIQQKKAEQEASTSGVFTHSWMQSCWTVPCTWQGSPFISQRICVFWHLIKAGGHAALFHFCLCLIGSVLGWGRAPAQKYTLMTTSLYSGAVPGHQLSGEVVGGSGVSQKVHFPMETR